MEGDTSAQKWQREGGDSSKIGGHPSHAIDETRGKGGQPRGNRQQQGEGCEGKKDGWRERRGRGKGGD